MKSFQNVYITLEKYKRKPNKLYRKERGEVKFLFFEKWSEMVRNRSNNFFDTMMGINVQGSISQTFPEQFVFVFLVIQSKMNTVLR